MSTGATKNKLNAVAFVYEVARVPTAADIDAILSAVKQETGETIQIQFDGTLLLFGGLSDFISHIVLDVAESAARNTLGAADKNQKSDLLLIGSNDYSVQPCFTLSEVFGDDTIAEIERLYKFVTGIDGVGYFNETRFYIDTNSPVISHGDMDVAEILVRRMIDGTSNSVEVQGFKALPKAKQRLLNVRLSHLFDSFDCAVSKL